MSLGWGRHLTAVALTVLYALAGAMHLAYPEPFLRITPPFVPAPAFVIMITGFLEIAGAAGLHLSALRRWAGLGLALYALCVWPANVYHAIAGVSIGWVTDSWWYHGPRLALQPVLIAAALYAGGWFEPRRRMETPAHNV